MARKTRRNQDEPEAAAEPNERPAGDESGSGQEAAELTEELPEERLERERAEYLSLWQRAQADYQNLKRRHHTDLEAGVRRALQPLLEDLLLVMDHMEMALASPTESADAKNLAFGVELVKKQLETALSNQDVSRIPPGGKFDPALHQAIAKEPRADVEPDSVIETVRQGYLWRESPLRFAQVRVAESPTGEELGQGGAEPTPRDTTGDGEPQGA